MLQEEGAKKTREQLSTATLAKVCLTTAAGLTFLALKGPSSTTASVDEILSDPKRFDGIKVAVRGQLLFRETIPFYPDEEIEAARFGLSVSNPDGSFNSEKEIQVTVGDPYNHYVYDPLSFLRYSFHEATVEGTLTVTMDGRPELKVKSPQYFRNMISAPERVVVGTSSKTKEAR